MTDLLVKQFVDKHLGSLLAEESVSPAEFSPEIMRMIEWTCGGDAGHVLCVNCFVPFKDGFNPEEHCFGCPQAWRQISGQVEYYREPKHELPEA